MKQTRSRPASHVPQNGGQHGVTHQDVAGKEQHGMDQTDQEQAGQTTPPGPGRRPTLGLAREVDRKPHAEQEGKDQKEFALEQQRHEGLHQGVDFAGRRARIDDRRGQKGKVDDTDADQGETSEQVHEVRPGLARLLWRSGHDNSLSINRITSPGRVRRQDGSSRERTMAPSISIVTARAMRSSRDAGQAPEVSRMAARAAIRSSR